MAMPNFIGIGAQKAGTTWLYDMLAQNPSVWLPPLKEVHFFDYLGASRARRAKRAAHIAKVARKLEKGKVEKGSLGDAADKAAFLRGLTGDNLLTEEWYASIFDHPAAAGRRTGEITPAYLELEENELDQLAAMLPNTRFILVIREPMARTVSQLKMAVARAKADRDGEPDWDHFLHKTKANARGNYQSAIPLWQKIAGPDRLLILPFSMVRNDPAGLLRQVEDFIGATRFDGYKALTEQVHKTKEVTVPDWVLAEIEAFSAPQKAYLIEAFGEDFYKSTR